LWAAVALAPHTENGKRPKPDDFVPVDKPPQHESQDIAALMELRKAFGLGDLELPDG
jgi:hypothetical protein